MKNLLAVFTAIMLLLSWSCNSDTRNGKETPIDSTNANGTAPATYVPNNPASDKDSVRENATDTGTHVNMGPDSVQR